MLFDLIRKSASYMVERFERNCDYPFIDTKFDICSGKDFGPGDEEFRQKDFIYGWIQGRGLESLAEHCIFFERAGEDELAMRLRNMAVKVLNSMERLRAANGGRVAFAITPEGKSIFPDTGDHGNYSDLFYSKGLFAAADMLNMPECAATAEKLFQKVLADIVSDRFRTDQHGFDPKNPVAFVQGKLIQGPRMIALYGLARLAAAHPENSFYVNSAAEIIRYIYEYHINTGQYKQLQKFDFLEAVDAGHKAWSDGGMILCDPGHALEFVGLAGKCLLEMRRQGKYGDLIAESSGILPEVFKHVFDFGSQAAGGIVKSFDLVSRRVVNSDMPWWSLPETIRAGMQLLKLYPEHSGGIKERVAIAQQAFFTGFVAAGTHGFACQTRDHKGIPVNVIPAVPDADPGYHTNCSFIDVLNL